MGRKLTLSCTILALQTAANYFKDYWSLQDGDSHGQWVDARLTPQGIEQAKVAHRAWKDQLQADIPSPQSFYVSPMNRCLATAQVTFDGLPIAGITPFRPIIKEVSYIRTERPPQLHLY